MNSGTSSPGNKDCPHDWKIVDTLISRMDPASSNPIFSLKCRRCGAEAQAKGHVALKNMTGTVLTGSGLG